MIISKCHWLTFELPLPLQTVQMLSGLQPDTGVTCGSSASLSVSAAFERGLSFKVGGRRSGECCCMGSPVSRAGGCVHALVVATTAALQRCLARPVVKKEPITPDMLQQLVQSIGPEPSLSELVLFVCLSLLVF